jgi:hypothetical protein
MTAPPSESLVCGCRPAARSFLLGASITGLCSVLSEGTVLRIPNHCEFLGQPASILCGPFGQQIASQAHKFEILAQIVPESGRFSARPWSCAKSDRKSFCPCSSSVTSSVRQPEAQGSRDESTVLRSLPPAGLEKKKYHRNVSLEKDHEMQENLADSRVFRIGVISL